MYLYHLTDKAGMEGIKRGVEKGGVTKQWIYPSVGEGRAHTHYGKGIYFTSMDPHFEACYNGMRSYAQYMFGKLSNENFNKMLYYLEINVDENLYPCQVVNLDDPKFPFLCKEIFLVEQEVAMDVTNKILDSGPTYFGQLVELGYAQKEVMDLPGSWKKK